MPPFPRRLVTALLILIPAAVAAPAAAQAPANSASARPAAIERVVSPGGIEAWLLTDRSLPLLAVSMSFPGGTAQDKPGKEGAADLAAQVMTEGAGDLDAEAFRAKLEDLSTSLSVSASRDSMNLSFRTLSRYRDDALGLLRLALLQPRFDEDALKRAKERQLSDLARAATSPGEIARDLWWRVAFAGHPYGRDGDGTEASVPALTADDLRGVWRDQIAREGVKIGVVGDIDAATLAPMLDALLGRLPAKPALSPVPPVVAGGGGDVLIVQRKQSQSVVTFGAPGLKRDDPDFEAAHLVNYILGGGGFSARLMREVREKAGLAYSVGTGLGTLDATGFVQGNVATANGAVARSIELIRQELGRMGSEGPTEAELDNAKGSVIDSFALNLDSTIRIAGFLVSLQRDGLGIDYLETRADRFRRVTLADAKRAAARIFDPVRLLFVVVGEPESLQATRAPPGAL
ncbi:zinc protease [Stella humosa]|uniref:Zinc protease n=1 Tax=Stella humosa TaxID=94 RepID=A0A3N1L8J9_9PROT|nr:pitrilysin family protein [Stella humosa]ROP91013.1 zinc protease [Stella humosa]BBK34637.1 peptidase M16 [Stella humosa]